MRCAIRLLMLVLAAACTAGCGSRKPEGAPAESQITVFAAASLTDAITEAARLFEESHHLRVVATFDASSTLARQISAGARADVFISADERWMDELARANAIDPATRCDLLGNTLVLIARKGRTFNVTMDPGFDFVASLPRVRRIAIADPAHVPAGRYAQQSLERLGWWEGVKAMLLPAQDVRAALRLVELDEADAGIVYSTDARASSKVEVVAQFPEDSHQPIVYPIAACRGAGPGAEDFIRFLRSREMTMVFERHGFRALSAR